jgi:hypothetical protein
MLIQHLQHTPKAHPIAIVAVGILAHVRIRGPGPGIPHSIVIGKVLIVLDVGGHPEGYAGAVGPFYRRTFDNGAVVYSTWW